jgi:hypothetical protein
MKNYLKITILITALFLLNSCSFFSKDEDVNQKEEDLKWKQETELEVNKDYHYALNAVSYKSNISQDTVGLVLKEYYATYKGCTFNNKTGKLEIIDEMAVFESGDSEKHKLDFINSIIKNQFVSEKTAYIVLHEIQNLFDVEIMKDNIQSIEESVSDINSHFEK